LERNDCAGTLWIEKHKNRRIHENSTAPVFIRVDIAKNIPKMFKNTKNAERLAKSETQNN
jgi:hypothetical protein